MQLATVLILQSHTHTCTHIHPVVDDWKRPKMRICFWMQRTNTKKTWWKKKYEKKINCCWRFLFVFYNCPVHWILHMVYALYFELLRLKRFSHNIVSLELSKYLCKWIYFFSISKRCRFYFFHLLIILSLAFLSPLNYRVHRIEKNAWHNSLIINYSPFLWLLLLLLFNSFLLLLWHLATTQSQYAINCFVPAKWPTECQDTLKYIYDGRKRWQRTSFYFWYACYFDRIVIYVG